MRRALVLTYSACAALAVASAACAHRESSTPPQSAHGGVAELQAEQEAPNREQRAHELLRMAEVQLRDLEDSRAAAADRGRVAAIDQQIAMISRYRDAVLADLADRTSARLDTDMWNLERSMQSAAVTAPQSLPLRAVPPRAEPQDDSSPGEYLRKAPTR